MVPIDSINADSQVELNDSCNCWSSCCGSKESKQVEKEKALTDKIRRIVMEELQSQKEINL